jgi:hypothetical protein
MLNVAAPVTRPRRKRVVKPFYAPYKTNEVVCIIESGYARFGAGLWRLMGADPTWDLHSFTEWLVGLDRKEHLTMVKMALRKMPELKPPRLAGGLNNRS